MDLEELLRHVRMFHEEMRNIVENQVKILAILSEILSRIESNQSRADVGSDVMDVMGLILLPDHLRKTVVALTRYGEATADDVARITGRARPLESSYLNQLVRMKHLMKRKRGRKVYFSIRE